MRGGYHSWPGGRGGRPVRFWKGQEGLAWRGKGLGGVQGLRFQGG